VRHRQASRRFGVGRAALVAADRPMRFASSTPCIQARRATTPERQEVDNAELVDRLVAEYPALSTSAVALAACYARARPASACARGTRSVRCTRSSRALSGWETLIVAACRPLPVDVVHDLTDALVARGQHRAYPGAITGMKSPPFAVWMLRQLGAAPGDLRDDLFPGSGAIGRAWSRYAGPGDDPASTPGSAAH